jgi:LPS-assembly protein
LTLATGSQAAELNTPDGVEDPYAPISAWAVCPPQAGQEFVPRFDGKRGLSPTYLSGELADRDSEGTVTLIGSAEAERADQRLQADRIIYRELEGVVEAQGQVRYDEPHLRMFASHGTIWTEQDRGEFHDTRFRFFERHGRGRANTTYLLEPGITQYKKATYTTCADNNNDWKVRASTVTLDENEGKGVAYNARLSLKGIPVLYTPYFSFPIDDRRKTGFLVPSFGSSDNSGIELTVPYYLNLAPNYDATITPRYLEDRGTQFNSEFRYLTSRQNGTINLEYLHDDKITEYNRSRFTVRDDSRFSKHLTTSIDYDRVSDKGYLDDLGDSLSLSSTTHLKRTIQADYATSWWKLGGQLDDYQTVDASISQASQPYQRLPRLTLSAAPLYRPLGLESGLDVEFVRFDHDQNVTGDRYDLQPSIRLPLRRTAFESIPKLGVRYTNYKLDDPNAADEQDLSRTTPFFSLDNTVFFERDFDIGSRRYMQTLEPRLYYLYVMSQNQDDLPLFDTSEPTFTYRELFEENRFNGSDRVGEANQLALAVTSRVLDADTGAELVRASAGQLFYFQNRTVTRTGSTRPEDDNAASDIAGDLQIALSRTWTGKADMVWNPRDTDTERANAQLQYHPGFRKIANLSYRYDRDSQNQLDASLLWPLTASWQVIGRYYYDLKDSQQLEWLGGIEYDTCCWGIRLVTREFIDTQDGVEEDNRIYLLQFVLKGLTRFGSDIESVLEDGILGYRRRPED